MRRRLRPYTAAVWRWLDPWDGVARLMTRGAETSRGTTSGPRVLSRCPGCGTSPRTAVRWASRSRGDPRPLQAVHARRLPRRRPATVAVLRRAARNPRRLDRPSPAPQPRRLGSVRRSAGAAGSRRGRRPVRRCATVGAVGHPEHGVEPRASGGARAARLLRRGRRRAHDRRETRQASSRRRLPRMRSGRCVPRRPGGLSGDRNRVALTAAARPRRGSPGYAGPAPRDVDGS